MMATAMERTVLRQLAEAWAQAAADPINRERAESWRRVNDLEAGRPMVWINEVPWGELNHADELTLQCREPFLRSIEEKMRCHLYQWRHFPADMIVEPYLDLPMVVHNSGLGLPIQEETLATDPRAAAVSHHYVTQFKTLRDVEKIRLPEVRVDPIESGRRREVLEGMFGDMLPVRLVGVGFQWFAPWDWLIMRYNPQEALLDLVDKPELMHAIMERFTTAMLQQLDQQERLGLLALNNGSCRIGSGGYGHTRDLPKPGFDPNRVRALDQWGNGVAQIFSDVSPAMHEEFALRYERRWMERFGLTYYGCCEPLHNKLDLLASLPNLRKVSMSPWADLRKAVAKVGRKWVLSIKPNPAFLAEDDWRPEAARADLAQALDVTQGCAVEVILKDVSTVRNRPQRLWEWSRLAMELVGG